MLNASIKPHRECLLAHSNGQKLFLALSLSPQKEATQTRPALSIAFVVDTSGSMREVVTEPTEMTGQTVRVDGQEYEVVRGASSKMDVVIQSLRTIIQSDRLLPQDRIAIVKFDDQSEVLEPFTSSTERARLLAAADRLSRYSGGTHMGAGMQSALDLLEKETGSRRMVLLSDGETFDAPVVEEQLERMVANHISASVVGVGDFNENLLRKVGDQSQGQLFDVVADIQNPMPPSIKTSDLPQALLGDLHKATLEVVTDVALSVRCVKEVSLDRITRVSPTQTEVNLQQAPHYLGNIDHGGAVYILEFNLPARPAVKVRLAQIGITYQVPGADYRGELPPIDVLVEFSGDEARAGAIDPEVMQWVQQRNIEMLVLQATQQAQRDPEQAQKTLEVARSMTQRLGQSNMTVALDRAINELGSSKTISLGTAKTLKIGSKTQTLRQDGGNLPTDEEIRRITGA